MIDYDTWYHTRQAPNPSQNGAYDRYDTYESIFRRLYFFKS